MTKVIHLAGSRAGIPVHASAQVQPSAAPSEGFNLERTPSPVERQAAIENALTMALYFIRQPGDIAANLWAATARANRALTLLKQASQGNAPVANANTIGRA